MTPQEIQRKRELLQAAAEEVKTAVLLHAELCDGEGQYCAVGFLAAKCELLDEHGDPANTDDTCRELADFFGLPVEEFEVIYEDNDDVSRLLDDDEDEYDERSYRAAEHFKRLANLLEAQ